MITTTCSITSAEVRTRLEQAIASRRFPQNPTIFCRTFSILTIEAALIGHPLGHYASHLLRYARQQFIETGKLALSASLPDEAPIHLQALWQMVCLVFAAENDRIKPFAAQDVARMLCQDCPTLIAQQAFIQDHLICTLRSL